MDVPEEVFYIVRANFTRKQFGVNWYICMKVEDVPWNIFFWMSGHEGIADISARVLWHFMTRSYKCKEHPLIGNYSLVERHIIVEICPVTRWWAVQPLDWRRLDLLINFNVVVGVLNKSRVLSLYECNLLIYVMILPCSLQKLLTRNRTLINVCLHVRTYPCRNLTNVSYIVQ